nr:MAG TPA: hypothetical protein [Caudoviricetes sp.]
MISITVFTTSNSFSLTVCILYIFYSFLLSGFPSFIHSS